MNMKRVLPCLFLLSVVLLPAAFATEEPKEELTFFVKVPEVKAPPLKIKRSRTYKVFLTSYNPLPEQTDATPCSGASGRDLCQAAKEGDRTIAVSQDLLWWNGGPFRYHDKIKVTSDIPQCNGIFSLEDTMNARFTNMGDLFFLTRAENTSCHAVIQKVSL